MQIYTKDIKFTHCKYLPFTNNHLRGAAMKGYHLPRFESFIRSDSRFKTASLQQW